MNRRLLLLSLLLAVTAASYFPVLQSNFLNFDDPGYVTRNVHVSSGLSWETVRWAFSTTEKVNWHPLTWLSHALDCTLFGAVPRYHHAVNLALHLVNTLLLFFLLEWLTGSMGRSLAVAAIFALHPLHVESVAWVAERKDLLCALFWLMTMGAYAAYVRTRSWRGYGAALLLFACALMSKPMAVTLPCVLLLADYWPLRRLAPAGSGSGISFAGAVKEKVPFFVLSAAASVLTYVIQSHGGATALSETLPLLTRAGHAVGAYLWYLTMTLYPAGLAVFYPHSAELELSTVMLGGLVLSAVTLLAWKWRVQYPSMIVGWLWFLGTLVPVIGLIQVGLQSTADRYTYLPMIGLSVMAVWAGREAVRNKRPAVLAVTVVGGALVALAMGFRTYTESGYWKNNVTLFTRAQAVTGNNHLAWNNLAADLADSGKHAEAIGYLMQAVRVLPDEPSIQINLARSLAATGRRSEALACYDRIIARAPDDAQLHLRMGDLLLAERREPEAAAHFSQSVRLDPSNALYRCRLAESSLRRGMLDEARRNCHEALALSPGLSYPYRVLGMISREAGNPGEAIAQFLAALRVDSTDAEAHNGLGVTYERVGRLDDALDQYRAAERDDSLYAGAQYNIGTAYAKKGNFDLAEAHLVKAAKLDPASGNTHANLGRLYMLRGKPAEAEYHLGVAISLDSTLVVARYHRGMLLARQGRRKEAANDFSRVIDLDPGNVPAREALSDLRSGLPQSKSVGTGE